MELIITEKRSIAKILSEALSDKVSSSTYSLKGVNRSYLFSSGHIIQLEEKIRTWDISAVERIINGLLVKTVKNTDFIKEAKTLLRTCSNIVLATDYDNEGEVIGRDVLDLINTGKLPVTRWKFSSLVKEELLKSYNKQESLLDSSSLFYKGEARREIDFLEGISATKLVNLRSIVGKDNSDQNFYSIGRVKAGIIRILDQRENLIQKYQTGEYYNYNLVLRTSSGLTLKTSTKEKYVIPSSTIFQYETKTNEVTDKPPKPYNTKRLVQKLALKYDPAFIKESLEKLYYSGVITYPRTDTELFDNNIYQQVVDKEIFTKDKIMSKKDFEKISIASNTVDHPAITPTFSNKIPPSELLFFSRELEKILLEPLKKTIKREVEYLEVRVDNHKFTTENKSNFKRIIEETKNLSKQSIRITKKPFNLSELLEVMSKYKIGTKSTQLPSICELESKNFFSRNQTMIISNKILVKEILRRLNKLCLREDLFNLEYCLEVQESIDKIINEKQLKNLISNVKEKWKTILTDLKRK